MSSNSYTLGVKRGESYDLIGEVSFTDGKIDSIERAWYVTKTPDDRNALAQVFYSAATSLLDGRGSSVCNVSVKSEDHSPSMGTSKTTTIECLRAGYEHSLILIGVDCSGGCSIGSVAGSLFESIRAQKAK